MEPLFYILLGCALMLSLSLFKSRFADFLAQRPADYADGTPRMDLREHLNGPIVCEGVLYGPTGRVATRFVGDFNASWDGNRGVMKEVFTYDSGKIQHREWRLELGNDGKVRAEADDVDGVGEGIQEGSALKLTYRLRLPEDSGGHVLDTVDWMYLTPNGTIVNRSQFRKYGIKVAELVATIRRKDN